MMRSLKALLVCSSLLVACGGSVRRFPLRAPLTHDEDEKPFGPAPEEYVSPFAWDGANQIVFRPIARFFAVDPAGRAANVNAFDEVPDSSWFTNRIGVAPLGALELARGPCDGKVLDTNAADKSWTIDQGKPNGANPGFRVNIPGVGKFMLKSDPEPEPDRATGATTVAGRFYHAAGYYAPCDSVVYFRPSLLSLKPGLMVTDNSGVAKAFDQKALDELLARASHRNGLVRMVASRWLSGKTIGPYRYQGTRDDDPNDVIPHEDRREVRGARILAAWLNHFDSREQNTMDVFVPVNPKDKSGSLGHVQHYILDLGDCFGSVWNWDGISRRLGFAYYLDVPYVAEDFVTLGIIERPWDRAQRTGKTFNYFSERDFDPEMWRGGYPNPAFGRMQEADGAWMARILARFDDAAVRTIVTMGQYNAEDTAYLARVLIARRDAILARYLSRLSPLTAVHLEGERLCATDLARLTGVAKNASAPKAKLLSGPDATPRWRLAVETKKDAGLCVDLAHTSRDGGSPDDDPGRYVVVDVANGHAPGVLRAHLYDLGPSRGFVLVGIERP
jgi:hypothetical protein